MDYRQAKNIRENAVGTLLAEQKGGFGSSLKAAISQKSKARAVGLKEKFDPLNIAKTLTGGSNWAPAMLGKLFNVDKKRVDYFSGVKPKSTANLQSSELLDSPEAVECLGYIYKSLKQSVEDKKLAAEQKTNRLEEEDSEEETRNQEIIKALTGRVKKEKPYRDEKGRFAKKLTEPKEKPASFKSNPARTSNPTPSPAPTSTKTSSFAKTSSIGSSIASTALKVGAGVAIVATGTGILSKAALATVKGEQNVVSDEDALKPNNDPKRVKKGEFLDVNTPKVGAATPDTRNSTSYGLFGISNVRSVDKKTGKTIAGSSSIDSFVKMYPQFGLPDPGDSTNKNQVENFNQSWWQLSKSQPKELLIAQASWFKKKFEDPAVEGLNGKVSASILNDAGVQLYMIDRRAQFGEAMLNSALNYAKGAKTSEEFINLISEHDRLNLRQIFRSTSDDEFNKLIKGLNNRIDFRKNQALGSAKSVPVSAPENSGNKINQTSNDNKNLKKDIDSSNNKPTPSVVNNNVNSVKSKKQTATVTVEGFDDTNTYQKKVRQ